jgi:hypothetical protein
LLIEFNRVKDSNPNLASIGFRTILCLVIRERAKIVRPHLALATKDDLRFEPDINEAIKEHIFTTGEEKLLKTYRDGGNKAKFDNVAHKAGDNMLMNKDDLEDAIDLLNTLLPSLVT